MSSRKDTQSTKSVEGLKPMRFLPSLLYFGLPALLFVHGMGHAMMLDAGWQAVADSILDWASSIRSGDEWITPRVLFSHRS